MWIEITGLPGSGKTTATSLLRRFLAHAGQPTHSPASALVGRHLARWLWSDTLHNRILERIPATGQIPFPSSWNRLHQLVAEIASTPTERRRLARAVQRQQRIAAIGPPVRRKLVVDEGPRQLLMSLWARTSSRRIRETLLRLDLPWPDHLVVVETPRETAAARLSDRGHLPFPDHPDATLPQRLAACEDALNNTLGHLPPQTRLWILANDATWGQLQAAANNIARAVLASSDDVPIDLLAPTSRIRESAA